MLKTDKLNVKIYLKKFLTGKLPIIYLWKYFLPVARNFDVCCQQKLPNSEFYYFSDWPMKLVIKNRSFISVME